MHYIIIISLLSSISFISLAVDPDSLVDQCIRKVMYHAYYRAQGYNLAVLQKKLPEDLHAKVATQLIALNKTISSKPTIICRAPIYSIADCNYDRLAFACGNQIVIGIIDSKKRFKSFQLTNTGERRQEKVVLEYCQNNRLAAGKHTTIKVWDIKHKKLKRQLEDEQLGCFLALAYCGSNRLVATKYPGASVWNVKSGQQILRLQNHEIITSLVYCGNDTIVSRDDHAINVWNIKSGKASQLCKSNIFADGRKGVALVDNNRIATVSKLSDEQDKLVIRNIVGRSNRVVYQTEKCHVSPFFMPDVGIVNLNNDYFASHNGFGTISIFHKQRTEPLLKLRYPKCINDMLLYDNRYLIAGTSGGAAVWDLNNIINPTLKGVIELHKGKKWYKKMLTQTLF